MSERLTLSVKENGKLLFACYWQWKGYTGPAAYILQDIIADYEKHPHSELSNQENFLASAQIKGVRFKPEDKDLAQTLCSHSFHFMTDEKQGDGHFVFGDEKIKNLIEWSETEASYDIATKELNFGVFIEEELTEENFLENNCFFDEKEEYDSFVDAYNQIQDAIKDGTEEKFIKSIASSLNVSFIASYPISTLDDLQGFIEEFEHTGDRIAIVKDAVISFTEG